MKSRCKTYDNRGKKRQCVIGVSPNPWGPLLGNYILDVVTMAGYPAFNKGLDHDRYYQPDFHRRRQGAQAS